jgi:hypothetical protein
MDLQDVFQQRHERAAAAKFVPKRSPPVSPILRSTDTRAPPPFLVYKAEMSSPESPPVAARRRYTEEKAEDEQETLPPTKGSWAYFVDQVRRFRLGGASLSLVHSEAPHRRLVCLRDAQMRLVLSVALWIPVLAALHGSLLEAYPTFSFFQATPHPLNGENGPLTAPLLQVRFWHSWNATDTLPRSLLQDFAPCFLLAPLYRLLRCGIPTVVTP